MGTFPQKYYSNFLWLSIGCPLASRKVQFVCIHYLNIIATYSLLTRCLVRPTNSPEPALLGFLLNGPMHGYDLYKQVNLHLSLLWRVGMSQMYAIVNAYVARGWIQTQVQSQELRPAKKLLEITPAGRQAFEEWLYQPAHGLREFRVDFFLRLYSARVLGVPAVQMLVDQQIESVHRELENLNKHRKSASEESELFQLTRDFRIQQLATILKWLESNRAQLIRLAKPLDAIEVQVAGLRRANPRRKKQSAVKVKRK